MWINPNFDRRWFQLLTNRIYRPDLESNVNLYGTCSRKLGLILTYGDTRLIPMIPNQTLVPLTAVT